MSSNIEVKLDVLNQLASPALYAAALANRPAAGFVGRLFIDSDSPSTGVYRDTGTTWVQLSTGASSSANLQAVTTIGNTTNTGIAISANGLGIGTTIPATNRIDIHSASGLQGTFNGTGTTNAGLQLQSAGVGKWTLQNNYNAGANEFLITDVLNTLNRITVKNTGQTFIGTDTSSSGLLVVNSSTGDNHLVVLGATAPSIRLRNTGTGATLNVGLGISTSADNFIQGSVSGNFCIFNSSTTASPILFGIYNGTNTQEAARITGTRRLLVNTSTDNGYQVDINGNTNITGNLTVSGTTPSIITFNRQSSSYTLAISDAGLMVEMNVATANNLTIPLNSAVPFVIGQIIEIAQYGVGQTTILPISGVTIRSYTGLTKLSGQYAAATLTKVGTNEWYLFGNLTA